MKKRLINFDSQQFRQDIINDRIGEEEALETLIMLLNEGYDVSQDPVLAFGYALYSQSGKIAKQGDRFVLKRTFKNTLTLEDLEQLEGIKVYKTKEEWDSRKKAGKKPLKS